MKSILSLPLLFLALLVSGLFLAGNTFAFTTVGSNTCSALGGICGDDTLHCKKWGDVPDNYKQLQDLYCGYPEPCCVPNDYDESPLSEYITEAQCSAYIPFGKCLDEGTIHWGQTPVTATDYRCFENNKPCYVYADVPVPPKPTVTQDCPAEYEGKCMPSCEEDYPVETGAACVIGGICCAPASEFTTNTPTANPGLEYETLETIPGTDTPINDFPAYLEALYKFVIWGVAIAALVMLVIGGFSYMTAAGNNAQLSKGKAIIRDALLGIIVALFSWLLLFTINPDLVTVDLSRLTSFSTGTQTPAIPQDTTPQPLTTAGTCQGLGMLDIKPEQCADASANLKTFLSCIQDEMPDTLITSISDDAAVNNLSLCQGTSYAQPPCAHEENSCHYGGHEDNATSCATDLYNSNTAALLSAMDKCGALYKKVYDGHVHASVSGCVCDTHN